MSAPLSSADVATLSGIGTSIVGFMKGLAPQMIIYGFYLAVMACCVYAHRKLGSLSRPRLVIFGVTVLMFITTSVQFWVNFAGVIVEINTYLLNPSQPVLTSRLKEISVVTKGFSISEDWFTPINFICSDIIVTWRAWSLCPSNRRKMLIVPYAFLLGTIATGILYVVYGTLIYTPSANNNLRLVFSHNQLAHLILSMMTNASATLIIWWKAWEYRRNATRPVSSYSASVRSSISAEHIVTLLLESGMVYCFLQAVAVFLELVFRYGKVKTATFGPVVEGYLSSLFIISALYPTLIVVIVAVHRSFTEASSFKSTTSNSLSPHRDVYKSSAIRFDDREDIPIAISANKIVNH